MAFCAMLSDNGYYTDMADFARSQRAWFANFLKLENGVPSHDVFRNTFMSVRPDALLEVLQEWCGPLLGKHLAIDGKALRGTYDRRMHKCMAHVLRAWVIEDGISAWQVMCDDKSNEITALPELLSALDLNGTTVTIDAMAGHPHIVQQIHAAGGHYVQALKANEKEAFETIKTKFEAIDESLQPAPRRSSEALAKIAKAPAKHLPPPMPKPQQQQAAGLKMAETIELSHGRYEHRRISVIQELSWYPKSWKWAGLQSIVRVERWTQSGELAYEAHYYLSDLLAEPMVFAKTIRAHWRVENSCHYVLDVTFNEDHCQVRDVTAAHNLCIMREMAIKVLKAHPSKGSVRSKCKRAAHDADFRTAILTRIP
jgi:predicted transposase YbfD/YdcC